MTAEELLGKHKRLREELSVAYAKPSWDTAHLNRITSELAALERLLLAGGIRAMLEVCQSHTEQPCDRLGRT